MIITSPPILPGNVAELVAPYTPHRIAVGIYFDPPSAAAFTLEAYRHLEADDLAELAPEYRGRNVRALWLRVRNHSSQPAVLRAEIPLGPETSGVQASLEQALESFRRQRREQKPD